MTEGKMTKQLMRLEDLRDVIVGEFPELAGRHFAVLTEGWDSVAVDVDGQLVFKFPRHGEAEQRLRREVRVLEAIGSAVSLRVPSLTLFEAPRLFSRHEKIAGEHLLAADYARLGEAERRVLGETLGQFYAELHAIPAEVFRQAGAVELEAWPSGEEILRLAWPVMTDEQRAFAEPTLTAWADLPPDPHGKVFGYFDGHGWNMAFDHAAGRLNGVYDFADGGFGPLHQEFLYAAMVSYDLTRRIADHYELVSGTRLDRERIALTVGVHRLWELAMEAGNAEAVPMMLASLQSWIEARPRAR